MDQANPDADYAAAGFGQGLLLGPRPALLMIDFARAYFAPESIISNAGRGPNNSPWPKPAAA